jgi:tetratricopeptide (TPR) repeat protein
MNPTDSEHKKIKSVDDLYERMNIKSKQHFRIETVLFTTILIILITLFGLAISNLTTQLSEQIKQNTKLVNRLDTIEAEMKAIRKTIYEKSGISVKEVQQQLVSEVIAKKVNRRSSPEQLKVIETYQNDKNYSDLKDNIYYLAKAVDLSAQDKLTQALAMVNKSIELKSNISTPYSVKSEIFAKQNKFIDAIAAQDQAIAIESKLPFSEVLPNYYNTRGFLHIKQKRLDKALADFHQGSDIAIGDEKSFILENAVLVALYQSEWQKAFDLSSRLIDLNVDGGWKWFLRAIAADNIKNNKEKKAAMANWQESVDANPNPNTIELLKKSLGNSDLSKYKKWL